MKISHEVRPSGAVRFTVHPFDGDEFTDIYGCVEPAVMLDEKRVFYRAHAEVNWPSIGAQSPKQTREFAAALIAAADAVEAKAREMGIEVEA